MGWEGGDVEGGFGGSCREVGELGVDCHGGFGGADGDGGERVVGGLGGECVGEEEGVVLGWLMRCVLVSNGKKLFIYL